MTHRTSAIVTCHNYGRFLPACLDSLLSQTEPFSEVILVDDGSTDGTREICERHYRGRVLYRRIEKLLQMEARNEGVSQARGDFLVHVDADDWLDKRYHELMIAPLLEDERAGWSYCGMRHVNAAGAKIPEPYHDWFDFDPYRLWISNYIAPTSIIRKEAWLGRERFFGIPLSTGKTLAEDWDLYLEIVRHGWQARFVPERLIFKRVHGDNITRVLKEDPDLRRTYRRRVRASYFQRELTVLVVVPSWQTLRSQWLEDIRALRLPADTQFVAIDASPAGLLRNRLPEGWKHFSLPFPFGISETVWRLSALRAVSRWLSGREILLLEAGVRLPLDAYSKMKAGKEQHQADFYSAGASSESASVRAVDSGSLSACLIDAHAWHELYPRLNQYAGGGHSLEWVFAQWSRAQKWRWFEDGALKTQTVPAKTTGDDLPPGLPSVSVVIPVKNGAKTIGPMLQSLTAVDYPPEKLEILVVDNGSTDTTAREAARFPAVRVLSEPKPGSYAARNRGIRESRFELIAFLDADLEVDRNWLRELVAPFLADPSVGAVAGGNLPFQRHWFSQKIRHAYGYSNLKGRPEEGVPPYAMTMNVCYRKCVFTELGAFSEAAFSGSDVEMSWRMQLLGNWKMVLLESRACVRHKDITGIVEWIRRSDRIGRGHYHLYRKFPHAIIPIYHWLPRRRWELALNLIKSLLLPRRPGSTRFRILQGFLFKLAYLAESLSQRAPERREKELILVHGTRPLSPSSRQTYLGGWNRAADCGLVIHLDPPRNRTRSLYELALTLLGGTTAWEWRPGLVSLAEWRLFPRHFKRLRGWEDRLTAWRLAKILRLKKGDSLRLLRSCSDPHVFTWQRIWRARGIQTAVLNDPRELGVFYAGHPSGPSPVVRKADVETGGHPVEK